MSLLFNMVLISVGVNRFGQQHRILREINNINSQNIFETLMSSDMVLNLACSSCYKIFETITDFDNHAATHDSVTQSSRYGGGNMYDGTLLKLLCLWFLIFLVVLVLKIFETITACMMV